MNNQLSISYLSDLAKEGERRRDVGIKRSTDHADRESEGWSEETYSIFVNEFLPNQKEFMMEDFRSWLALKDNYNFPPSSRAFGYIPKRALKDGLIKWHSIVNAKNVKAHRTPVNVWSKL